MIYHNIVCLLTYPSQHYIKIDHVQNSTVCYIISKPSRPGASNPEQHPRPAQGRRDLARAPQLLHP